MELILTGSPTTASEMERFGVVTKVCPAEDDVLEEALKVAIVVAAYSAPAIGLAKQAVKAGKHLIVEPNSGEFFD
jgi:enoyl-CoA hydratase